MDAASDGKTMVDPFGSKSSKVCWKAAKSEVETFKIHISDRGWFPRVLAAEPVRILFAKIYRSEVEIPPFDDNVVLRVSKVDLCGREERSWQR